MKSLLIALVAIVALFVPALAHAQERATVDANYVGGSFGDMYSYPLDVSIRSGKTFDVDGIAIGTEVRLTEVVSVGYRFEHLGLRHSQFVTESVLTNGNVQRLAEPDLNAAIGALSYQEYFGSFKLSRTHGHSLIVGLAKNEYEQEWYWQEQGGVGTSKYGSSAVGLVIGGKGKQNVGQLTLDYAGRLYPRMANTTGYEGMPSQFKSIGFELRGTATWAVAKHVGIIGGYQFRRMGTDISATGANGQPWPMHENQDNKGFLVGTRVSF